MCRYRWEAELFKAAAGGIGRDVETDISVKGLIYYGASRENKSLFQRPAGTNVNSNSEYHLIGFKFKKNDEPN